jgi:hypothetical protein
MLDRLMGAMIRITVVLASSSVALPQNIARTTKSQGSGGVEQALLTRMIYLDFGTSRTSARRRRP